MTRSVRKPLPFPSRPEAVPVPHPSWFQDGYHPISLAHRLHPSEFWKRLGL